MSNRELVIDLVKKLPAPNRPEFLTEKHEAMKNMK